MTAKKDYKKIVLPEKYVPKKTEKYMCDEQKAFFYQMLMDERRELEDEIESFSKEANLGQKMGSLGAMDEGDAATLAMDTDLNIKMQELKTGLLESVDFALKRLEDGTYGYSVLSGDEIGLKRLMVRPTAKLTTEEKEDAER